MNEWADAGWAARDAEVEAGRRAAQAAGPGSAGKDDLVPAAAEMDADAIGRLLDEPATVDEYRSRARERAKRYSWEAVTDEYEQLLRAVREAHNPGRLPPELVDIAPRQG